MGKQHLSRDDRIFMCGKLQGTREWNKRFAELYEELRR